MQPFLVAADAYRRIEQLAQAGFREQFLTRAVANDAAVAHEDDSLDFGKNVSEVMRDEHKARPFLREPAQRLSQFPLRGQVERV